MLHVGHQQGGLFVLVDIDIICQYARCRNSQSGILIRRVGVIDCLDLVFHIRHRDGNGSGVAGQRAVIGCKGKAVIAKIIKVRSVDGNLARQNHVTVIGLIGNGIRQLIVFNIACHEGDSHGGFFRSGYIILVLSHWSVVHWSDRNGNGGNVAVNNAVIGLKGKAVIAVEIRFRSVGGNVAFQLHLTVIRFIDDRISQLIIIHIGGNQGNLKRIVLRSFYLLVFCNRSILHQGDVDGDGSRVTVSQAVIGRKGKAVIAKIVRGRSVGGNFANQGHRTVIRFSVDRISQLSAFNIRPCQGNLNRSLFISGHIILVICNRSVIHRIYRNGNGGRAAVSQAVIGLEGEGIWAVVVQGGCVGGNVVNHAHATVSGSSNDRISQRLAVHIGGVTQGNLKLGVLRSGHSLAICIRNILHRVDRDGDGSREAVQRAVIDLEGKGIWAVVVQGRSVSCRCTNQGHSTVNGLSGDRISERTAIHIASRKSNIHEGVFQSAGGTRRRFRSVVHRGDVDGNGGSVAVSRAVIRLVGEAVRSVVVQGGGSVGGYVINHCHRTICRLSDD